MTRHCEHVRVKKFTDPGRIANNHLSSMLRHSLVLSSMLTAPWPCSPTIISTPVLVPVPMAQEYEAVTTLLQVCGIDTKTTNKTEVFLNSISKNLL